MDTDNLKEITEEPLVAEDLVQTPVIKRVYRHTPHKKPNNRKEMIKNSRRINRK